MTFMNEEIPQEDRIEIDLQQMQSLAGSRYGTVPRRWAIDRERDVFVMLLEGGSSEKPAFYGLGIQGEAAVFNARWKGEGNNDTGVRLWGTVFNLRLPNTLEPRTDEIMQLIREALNEHCEFGNRRSVTSVTIQFE